MILRGAGRYCFREVPEQYSPLDHAVGFGCVADSRISDFDNRNSNCREK